MRLKRGGFGLILATFAFLGLVAPVLANNSFYNWTMYNRVVNGSSNGQFHQMTAGNLTNQGQVWVISTDPGHLSSPYAVHIDVYKDDFVDSKICGTNLVPYTNGQGKSYSQNCGSISSGSYYLIIWKTEDDGWNESGQGNLITP